MRSGEQTLPHLHSARMFDFSTLFMSFAVCTHTYTTTHTHRNHMPATTYTATTCTHLSLMHLTTNLCASLLYGHALQTLWLRSFT